MLSINNKKSGYSHELAAQYLSSDLPMINVTQKPEEVPVYDSDNHKYLDHTDHINIYVVQNAGDFIQNPLRIKITGFVPKDLKFGDLVKIKGLEACRYRNNGYSQVFFRGNEVKIIKEDDK